ncbi:unnamed protein product, partial [Polarella glacialis]
EKLQVSVQLGIRTGAIGGLLATSLALGGMAGMWFWILDTQALSGFGSGASIVSFYMRVGGGIFAKGAELGGDLIGEMTETKMDEERRVYELQQRMNEMDKFRKDRKKKGLAEEEEDQMDQLRMMEEEMRDIASEMHPIDYLDGVGENICDVCGTCADLFESMVLILATSAIIGSKGAAIPHFMTGLPFWIVATGNFGCAAVAYKSHIDDRYTALQCRWSLRMNLLVVGMPKLPLVLIVLALSHGRGSLLMKRGSDELREAWSAALTVPLDKGVLISCLFDLNLASGNVATCLQKRLARTLPSEQYLQVWRSDEAASASTEARQFAKVEVPKVGPVGQISWKSRGAKAQVLAERPDQRAAAEEVERQRWNLQVCQIVIRNDLPVLKVAATSLDPDRALANCTGRARSKTLRKKVRTWLVIENWLKATFGLERPTLASQMVDYIEDRATEPCGRTAPATAIPALRYFEKVGEVECPMADSALLLSTVSRLEVQLATNSAPTKKAPLYFFSQLISLKLFVACVDFPLYYWAFAWYKLVKVWASLRSDDCMGLQPCHLKTVAGGIEFMLERTKTSGPGRRVRWLKGYVSSCATITGNGWLETGLLIWLSVGFAFNRDYFLPEPNEDFSGCRAKPSDWSSTSARSRALFRELRQVKFDGMCWDWDGNLPLVLHPQALLFWTDHSERNVLTSVAALLNVPKSERDFLGRWSPDGSDDHLRTSRQMVHKVQVQVAQGIRDSFVAGGLDLERLGDNGLFEYLRNRGVNEDAARDCVQGFTVKRVAPPSDDDGFGPGQLEPMLEDVQPKVDAELKVNVEFKDDESAQSDASNSLAPLYFVSFTKKRKFARLHLIAGCPLVPGVSVAAFEYLLQGERQFFGQLFHGGAFLRQVVESTLADEVRAGLLKVLHEKLNVKRVLFQLACNQFTSSPFEEALLLEGIEAFVSLLRKHGAAGASADVPPGQPVRLPALENFLQLCGDPDFRVFHSSSRSFSKGVTLGILGKLPRVPAVFDKKERWRTYPEEEGEPGDGDNYVSARDNLDSIKKQFEEERALGAMREVLEVEARKEYGSNLLIAPIGAIEKADASFRVIHDGTHKVKINPRIRARDQHKCPGTGELKTVMRSSKKACKSVFGLTGDVKRAHRLPRVWQAEWGLQACKLSGDTVWLNEVGTFGMGPAAYHWARESSGMGRACLYLTQNRWFYQLLYADDFNWVSSGAFAGDDIMLAIFFLRLLGVPMSWKKFHGGLQYEWVGYWSDLRHRRLGISKGRADWLVRWMSKALVAGSVCIEEFKSVLGRMGFAMRALETFRPFLGPLYAWSSAVPARTFLPLPVMIRLILIYLKDRLKEGSRTAPCGCCQGITKERFRADAKADGEDVKIGGWECLDADSTGKARWFSEVITRENAPWVFEAGEPFRTIATLELLATLCCLVAFPRGPGPGNTEEPRALLTLGGSTDNLGNKFVVAKLQTTKYPLVCVLMEIAAMLHQAGEGLDLQWVPRLQNIEADQLTNGDFRGFDPALRVRVNIATHPWVVLNSMLKQG